MAGSTGTSCKTLVLGLGNDLLSDDAIGLPLNLEHAEQEAKGQPITPLRLAAFVPDATVFTTLDCIEPPGQGRAT